MKVLKFGGTSMGSSMAMLNVKRIVESLSKPVVVVVSAVSGITDSLISAANLAASQKNYTEVLTSIKANHKTIIDELFAADSSINVEKDLEPVWFELDNILKGISLTGELSLRSYDTISGCGERLSSVIITYLIDGAKLFDSRQYISTSLVGKTHQVDYTVTNKAIQALKPELTQVSVFPGYIAANAEGENTTLGRGGSDYSAAILAAGLDAEILEIWTDVDGFMSADPRVISRAYCLDHLSYAEAMELSHFGAKVIYPPTIIPALQKQIPIKIKNTFNPQAPGTLIDGKKNGDSKKIKGLSSIRDVALITVQGMGMIGISGISMRLFSALAINNINIILISQASSENSISIVVSAADAQNARTALLLEFDKEIERKQINGVAVENKMAVVAIVGEGMKHTAGVSGQLFQNVGKNGINVYAIAQGASELNISFVIEEKDLKKTLNVVHEAFFLSQYQVLNLYLAGVGTVGKNLLEKIERQKEHLLKNKRLLIRVAGMANSRQMIFNERGLDISTAVELLKDGETGGVDVYVQKIVEFNLANSVFVDCTASDKVANEYLKILKNNVSVVTANKIAGSSEYATYASLKNMAREKGVKYLFETNVGAGLPIINTINSMVNSGDRILELEGVLSGTLNYIVNTVSETKPLSEVVLEAKQKGFSEPDPRIDLRGTDVLRKLLILARESNYPLEQQDIEITPFIPEEYFVEESVEDFMKRIKTYDAEFEAKRKAAADNNSMIRYTASLKDGKAKVDFSIADETHPFYRLEGSNNKVMLRSDYYFDHPMEIKGYGAGADVTAAGVFADIIKVVNL